VRIIRDPDTAGIETCCLAITWGLRRCNYRGCTQRVTTIIAQGGEDVPVFALCEKHYQQGAQPGGTRLDLVFDCSDGITESSKSQPASGVAGRKTRP